MTSGVESKVNNESMAIRDHLPNLLNPSQSKITLSWDNTERPSSQKTECGRTFYIDELLLEIVKIRNRALNSLKDKHGLNLDQIMTLKLSDIDLEAKMLALKSKHRSAPHYIALTEDTVNVICAYLRVRSPSKEKELFLPEENLSIVTSVPE